MIDWHINLDAGISGDMFLAACLDLGLDESDLRRLLQRLDLSGWNVDLQRQQRCHGMMGTRVQVQVDEQHHHRHLHDILAIIERAGLPQPVAERAVDIFHILAAAEATVHGVAPEAVHFHEVGAVDAILDICAAAWAIEQLSPASITATPLQAGCGSVLCQHGRMPVPVPAVAEMVRRYAIPLQPEAVTGEAATPTGVAILAHLAPRYGQFGLKGVTRIGVGLGHKSWPDRTNALRLLVCDKTQQPDEGPPLLEDQVALLSTHIDDMNPQWYGPLWQQLLDAGALDVTVTPVTMKKGRPAIQLEVMASVPLARQLASLLLQQTTTLGVRWQTVSRLKWARQTEVRNTPWGDVRVIMAGGIARIEFDDLAVVARQQQWSLAQAQQQILAHV
ncbi:MAG: nickel pincer cofactor biosynthesis protein LarC [Magnetococcales bacterium]|nr:nickel pincer cofactor biosynthesis protein LarC [Magnetococcales bacterium]